MSKRKWRNYKLIEKRKRKKWMNDWMRKRKWRNYKLIEKRKKERKEGINE